MKTLEARTDTQHVRWTISVEDDDIIEVSGKLVPTIGYCVGFLNDLPGPAITGTLGTTNRLQELRST